MTRRCAFIPSSWSWMRPPPVSSSWLTCSGLKDVLRGLLKGDEETGFALQETRDEKLHAENALPGARTAFHDGGALLHETAADELVETRDACRDARDHQPTVKSITRSENIATSFTNGESRCSGTMMSSPFVPWPRSLVMVACTNMSTTFAGW